MLILVSIYAFGVIGTGAITGYYGLSTRQSALLSFSWPLVLLLLVF